MSPIFRWLVCLSITGVLFLKSTPVVLAGDLMNQTLLVTQALHLDKAKMEATLHQELYSSPNLWLATMDMLSEFTYGASYFPKNQSAQIAVAIPAVGTGIVSTLVSTWQERRSMMLIRRLLSQYARREGDTSSHILHLYNRLKQGDSDARWRLILFSGEVAVAEVEENLSIVRFYRQQNKALILN